MNKKGVTILELLISISMVSVVILLLVKVMFSLNNVNNDNTYASNDEIKRTEIIKNIESDFLKLKLNGIDIIESDNITLNFKYQDEIKKLTIEDKKITYDNETYTLNSENATYDLCIKYTYKELENEYYLIKITIPVLINNKNTTINDDIVLTYIGLKNSDTSFLNTYNCSKK